MEYTSELEISKELYESLVKAAKQTGQKPEELAREWLATAIRTAIEDPVENFIGSFKSRIPDWSDQHDQYIGQTLMTQAKNADDKGD